jgi:hypothetical protein
VAAHAGTRRELGSHAEKKRNFRMSTLFCSDDNSKSISFEDLETMLKRLLQKEKEETGFFSQWEADFITDMAGRYLEYGANLYLTSKQLKILDRLDERF